MPVLRVSDIKLTPEVIARYCENKRLFKAYSDSTTPQERWALIREAYAYLTPIILERAAKGYLGMTNTYTSPIEYDAWFSIRAKGLGLFPQYPALNYFLDFGNPYLKVAVELDGQAWHSAEKDKVRDERLLNDGWFIFRIPGKECYTKVPNLYDIESDGYLSDSDKERMTREYFVTTSDGVFEAVTLAYFVKEGFRSPYFHYAMESLSRHRLADFDVYDKVKGF
jgi:very-short-patch-repair endonuclease